MFFGHSHQKACHEGIGKLNKQHSPFRQHCASRVAFYSAKIFVLDVVPSRDLTCARRLRFDASHTSTHSISQRLNHSPKIYFTSTVDLKNTFNVEPLLVVT